MVLLLCQLYLVERIIVCKSYYDMNEVNTITKEFIQLLDNENKEIQGMK